MACNLIAEIYVDDKRMAAFELLSPILPVLPAGGGKATLGTLHPRLGMIEVEVLYATMSTGQQSGGYIVRSNASDWALVAAHLKAHGWETIINTVHRS